MFKEYLHGSEVYIIAEVGQNHQGDLTTAIRFIEEFSRLGANAIKFQMRNNEYLFTERAFSKPYDSENAFAGTYGEHRNFLEFSLEEWQQLKR